MQTVQIRELEPFQVKKILKRLRGALCVGDKEVSFVISSRGGDHDAVFELIEFLAREKFHTSCFVRRAGSAAALLAISCESRAIKKDGKMLLHAVELVVPVTLILGDGTVPKSTLEKSRGRQNQVETLILERTRIPPRKLTEIMAPCATGTFNAKQAVRWGLVDVVVEC